MPTRWFLTVGTLIMITALGVGCSSPDETPAPESTGTEISGNLSPTVTPSADQLVPISSVGAEHLSGMTLTQDDVIAEFPNLVQTGGGYLSHRDVSDHTISPADTGVDLETKGLVDGYEDTFQDLSELFSFTVSSDVYRWNNENSAETFISTEISDLVRLNGSGLQEGILLAEVTEIENPNIGSSGFVNRRILEIDLIDSSIATTVAMWQRGTVVASVRILASPDIETEVSIGHLAMRMNERIDAVLAGESPPQAVPTPTSVPEQASPDELRLSLMLLGLDDLPTDTKIRQEGPLDVSGASAAYQRRFMPRGTIFKLGNSDITEIQTTVGLYVNPDTASAPINVLRDLGPEGAGQLLAQGFATGAGIPADGFSVEALDFPDIGDDSYALLLHMKSALLDLDGHLVYFVRDQVRAQYVVFGLAGSLSLEDTIPLAQLIDQRIQGSTP